MFKELFGVTDLFQNVTQKGIRQGLPGDQIGMEAADDL